MARLAVFVGLILGAVVLYFTATSSPTKSSITGETVTSVETREGVEYRMDAPKIWREYNAGADQAVRQFSEIDRDEWSVYLKNAKTSTGVQIDLYQRRVYFTKNGGPKQAEYFITDADQAPIANVENLERIEEDVTGQDVKAVELGTGGRFVFISGKTWRKYDANGTAVQILTETDRDAWSVYLSDKSKDMQLQIDLYRSKVGLGVGGNAVRDTYSIVSASRSAS